MKLQIKMATVDDIKVIAVLFNEYRIFYNQTNDMDGSTNFFQERITKNESTIFIAFLDDEPAGFTQLYSIFSSVSLKKAWLLNDIYVAETARRQGVANALLDKAKEFGTENNVGWLLLETAFDNYKAQSVYEKNGWIKQTDFFYQFTLSV